MSHSGVYPIPQNFKNSHITPQSYNTLYRQSLEDPETFWSLQAQNLISWKEPWRTVSSGDFTEGTTSWFVGGKLNVCFNCVDRHLPNRSNQIAITWEGDNPQDNLSITYGELCNQVCVFANVLKSRGVSKGDRVCIYMPMIPEAAFAMLACARIGAVHSVVFGGFSPAALKERINDASCKIVITADEGVRGGKKIPLKDNVDIAIKDTECVDTVIVVRRTGGSISWQTDRDIWLDKASQSVTNYCEPEWMDSEDPLFILYTSGSTGKPKGVLHSTGGYLLQAAMSMKYVFDYQESEVFWCTADVGWVTGHTYIVYGPLAIGACTLMFEGVPTYPDATRFWKIIDKHRVNLFFTAPTAIRALHSFGDDFVSQSSRQSLRVLGSVGEPINPEAWHWYHTVVGDGRCPIVDTWWQTETGAIMITPLPGAHDLKPGFAGLPFFGIEPALLNEEGDEIQGSGTGYLVIKRSWPAQIRTIYGDHKRMIDTYFTPYPGYYFTGDGALRDDKDCFRITGRVDDVLNVSGHRLGTAEIESALVLHEGIAEAAVVGFTHPLKGQGIQAFITPMVGVMDSESLREQLVQLCVKEIGPIAKPDIIQWSVGLPKTRSGKIMRRILRKIAEKDFDNLGDISTLAEPEVVKELINAKQSGMP